MLNDCIRELQEDKMVVIEGDINTMLGDKLSTKLEVCVERKMPLDSTLYKY